MILDEKDIYVDVKTSPAAILFDVTNSRGYLAMQETWKFGYLLACRLLLDHGTSKE